MTIFKYFVEPQARLTRAIIDDVIIVHYPLLRSHQKNFWYFLKLNFFEQLDLIFLRYLLKRDKIKFERRKVNEVVKYQTIRIDPQNIINDYQEYIDGYIAYAKKPPKYLFVGRDEYRKLQEFCLKHSVFFKYSLLIHGSREMIQSLFDIKIVFTPWMKGVFLWNGDED